MGFQHSHPQASSAHCAQSLPFFSGKHPHMLHLGLPSRHHSFTLNLYTASRRFEHKTMDDQGESAQWVVHSFRAGDFASYIHCEAGAQKAKPPERELSGGEVGRPYN